MWRTYIRMLSDLALGLFITSAITISGVIRGNAQPTTLDFDFCEDGAVLRHVIRNLEVLTGESKALRLLFEATSQGVQSGLKRIETMLSELRQSKHEDREAVEKISDQIMHMENYTHVHFQELMDSISSEISQQTCSIEQVITNSSVHLSEELDSNISDRMETLQTNVERELVEIMDSRRILDTCMEMKFNETISKVEGVIGANKQYYHEELEELNRKFGVHIIKQHKDYMDQVGHLNNTIASVGGIIYHRSEIAIANSTERILSHVTETVLNSTSNIRVGLVNHLEALRNDSLASEIQNWQRLSTLMEKGSTDISEKLSMRSKMQKTDFLNLFQNVSRSITLISERLDNLSENILENLADRIMSHVTGIVRDFTGDVKNAIVVPLKTLHNQNLAAKDEVLKKMVDVIATLTKKIFENTSMSVRRSAEFILKKGNVDLIETLYTVMLNISRDVLDEIGIPGIVPADNYITPSPLKQTMNPGTVEAVSNVGNNVVQFFRLIRDEQTTSSGSFLQNFTTIFQEIVSRTTGELRRDLQRTNLELLAMVRKATGPQNGEIRLAGGSEPMSGRVELYVGAQWGTVCDDAWQDVDAAVVCRQLGLCGGIAHAEAHHGSASGTVPIYLDDVNCAGSEKSLLSCDFGTFNTHNCGHNEDAGVTCSAC